MADYLVRCITDQSNVVGLASITTDLVSEAARTHRTSRTATAALGRSLTGSLLMGALMKHGQRIALKFEGNGPLKKIVVEADSEGTVRGFVGVPDAEAPLKEGKLNVSGILGSDGVLTVIKDLGLKEPYKGIVKLQSGEIAEDIAYYLAESEQIPSAMGLGVFVEPDGRVSAAGGFLVQTLFSQGEGTVDLLIENIRQLPFVTELLRQGKMPEDILARIFTGIPYHEIERRNLSFHCPCRRQRVERALIILGADELKKLIAGHEETEVTCEYCRKSYRFTKAELEALLGEVAS